MENYRLEEATVAIGKRYDDALGASREGFGMSTVVRIDCTGSSRCKAL